VGWVRPEALGLIKKFQAKGELIRKATPKAKIRYSLWVANVSSICMGGGRRPGKGGAESITVTGVA